MWNPADDVCRANGALILARIDVSNVTDEIARGWLRRQGADAVCGNIDTEGACNARGAINPDFTCMWDGDNEVRAAAAERVWGKLAVEPTTLLGSLRQLSFAPQSTLPAAIVCSRCLQSFPLLQCTTTSPSLVSAVGAHDCALHPFADTRPSSLPATHTPCTPPGLPRIATRSLLRMGSSTPALAPLLRSMRPAGCAGHAGAGRCMQAWGSCA